MSENYILQIVDRSTDDTQLGLLFINKLSGDKMINGNLGYTDH